MTDDIFSRLLTRRRRCDLSVEIRRQILTFNGKLVQYSSRNISLCRLKLGLMLILYCSSLYNLSTRNENVSICRYIWHSAGSLGWPFPMLKYKYISQIRYTEAILSTNTRKLLWFEITKMLIAV